MRLYQKIGEQFVPIDGFDTTYMFPSDGNWIVETDEHGIKHCDRIGEKPFIYPFTNIERYRKTIEQALSFDSKEDIVMGELVIPAGKMSVIDRTNLIIRMLTDRLIEEKENRNIDKLDFL